MMKPIYCLLALYCSTLSPLLCLAFTTPYTIISNTRTTRVYKMINEDFNNDKNGNEDDLLLLNRLNELKQQNLNVLSQVSSTSKDASEVFQEERAHILNQILELEKSITLSNRNTDNENDVKNVAHVEDVANNYFVEQQQEAVVENESKEEKKKEKENDNENTSTISNENQKSSFPSNIQSLKETLASLEKLLDQAVSLMEKEEEMKGTKTTSDDNDISTSSSSSVVSKGIGPGSSDYTITTLKIPIQKTIPGLKDFSKRILETSNTLSSVKEYLDFFYNTNNDKGTEEKEVDTSSDTMNPARIEKILLLEHKEIIKLQEEIKNAIDTTKMKSKYGEEIQQQQQQKKKMKHVPYASRPFTVMKTIGIK